MAYDPPVRLTVDGNTSPAMRYVYAVVSRRARGVSIGINLNTNNGCNWRCVYCQVPELVRGAAPPVDLEQLRVELTELLQEILQRDYLERHVPEGLRRLNDVAVAGRGEPTTSRQFAEVIELIGACLEQAGVLGQVNLVLITNGSLVHRPWVQQGLASMAKLGGEVWFKLDSATAEGRARLNDTSIPTERVAANLELASKLCRTRIQTMALECDGLPPSEHEQQAWLELVRGVLDNGAPIADVLLYGLDRPSNQPEAPRLAKLPTSWLEGFARRIETLGLPVHIHI